MDFQKIRTNLTHFLNDLHKVEQEQNRKITPLFATKYLDNEQFVSFIRFCVTLHINPLYIGENRVQDARQKLEYLMNVSPILRNQCTFVLIGNLQKNKVNKALELFDEIHSVDSIELAKDLNAKIDTLFTPSHAVNDDCREEKRSGWHGLGASPKRGPLVGIFGEKTRTGPAAIKDKITVNLELNISGETTKHGFKPEEIDSAVTAIKQFENISIKGLMTMAPYSEDPEASRPIFRKLKLLANRHKLKANMGMSNDWKIAVDEGSDIVRIGSAIFKSDGQISR